MFARDYYPRDQDLHLFFRQPPADCRDWRCELHLVLVSTELTTFLASDWPGIAPVFGEHCRFPYRFTCT